MNKTILPFLFVWALSPVVNAQESNDYLSFIEEGKVWIVGDGMMWSETPYAILTYYFDGDTIVGGQTCKKWMCDVSSNSNLYLRHDIRGAHKCLLAAIYEENKQVWFFREGEDEPSLLYDFSGEVSDDGFRVGCFEEDYDTNCYIDYAGTDDRIGLRYVSVHDDIMLQDESLRRWFATHKGDCEGYWTAIGYRWYEGIGTMFTPELNVPHKVGEYRDILRVSVGEEIIYEHPRAKEIIDAIRDIPASQIVNGKSLNGKWYDLSGRRVSRLPKGVYIKDGRKVVVK